MGMRETKISEANDTFIQQGSTLLPYRHRAMEVREMKYVRRSAVVYFMNRHPTDRIESNRMESKSCHFISLVTSNGWVCAACRYQLNRDAEILVGTEESTNLDGRMDSSVLPYKLSLKGSPRVDVFGREGLFGWTLDPGGMGLYCCV